MFETKAGIIKPIVYVGLIQGNRLLVVDYKESPNPTKSGWWIPAPGLAFGEDPEEKARTVAEELGAKGANPKLLGVESFVLPGGWHLIYHYTVRLGKDSDLGETLPGDIKRAKWVSGEDLERMEDLAHGRWEIGVGKRYLES